MKALAVLACLLLPGAALAQVSAPALDACRDYAKRELARDGAQFQDLVFDADRDLLLERAARKPGKQLVASILSGNGAVVYETAPSVELSFVCLLAGDKRPLFFYWVPRRQRSALAQCTRSAALRAGPRACLEGLLQLEERSLGEVYALRLQEARSRDAAAGHEQAYGAYRRSNEAWLQYRDAECARRSAGAAAGRDPDDTRLACMIELSRLRVAEMRE